MDGADELRVYWQPGCTSCLRTRELLRSHGVPFVSINVLEDPQALAQLRALGVRAVPVIAHGGRFVLGQDLAEVARFVGIAHEHRRLPPAELVARLEALLERARRLVALIPAQRLGDTPPGRPRRHADLAFHVGMIVQALLDAARGGVLEFEYFERRAPAGADDPAALAAGLARRRDALADWWRRSPPSSDALLRTYYGERPLHEVLERSAWHVAQHLRQLDFIVAEVLAVPEAPRLQPAELAGLPLPRDVWDPEIRFA